MHNKYEDRLLFLKQFTRELILQSKPPEYEIEKQRKDEKHYGEFIPSALITEKTEIKFLKPEPKKRLISSIPVSPRYKIKLANPMLSEHHIFTRSIHPEIKIPSQQAKPNTQIQPRSTSELINLEKLNIFIKDPRITVIECSGPGKLILAKTTGEIKVTKTSLTKEEIQKIIKTFSEKSKIPIISGLFKAAVGNLVITAVISDLVGSRFIITKMTPRFMLGQQGLGY